MTHGGVRSPVSSNDWQRGFFQLAAELNYMRNVGRAALSRRAMILAVAKRSRLDPAHLLDKRQKERYTGRWRDILIAVFIKHGVSVGDCARIFDKTERNIYRCYERGTLNDRRVIEGICGAIATGTGLSHGANQRLGLYAR